MKFKIHHMNMIYAGSDDDDDDDRDDCLEIVILFNILYHGNQFFGILLLIYNID